MRYAYHYGASPEGTCQRPRERPWNQLPPRVSSIPDIQLQAAGVLASVDSRIAGRPGPFDSQTPPCRYLTPVRLFSLPSLAKVLGPSLCLSPARLFSRPSLAKVLGLSTLGLGRLPFALSCTPWRVLGALTQELRNSRSAETFVAECFPDFHVASQHDLQAQALHLGWAGHSSGGRRELSRERAALAGRGCGSAFGKITFKPEIEDAYVNVFF